MAYIKSSASSSEYRPFDLWSVTDRFPTMNAPFWLVDAKIRGNPPGRKTRNLSKCRFPTRMEVVGFYPTSQRIDLVGGHALNELPRRQKAAIGASKLPSPLLAPTRQCPMAAELSCLIENSKVSRVRSPPPLPKLSVILLAIVLRTVQNGPADGVFWSEIGPKPLICSSSD